MEKSIQFLVQFEKSAKVITQTTDGKIQTLNDIVPEKYNKLVEQHLLGKIRLGVAPEIRDSEKVLFGCIDIDCKDLSIQEKYNIALKLKEYLQKEYCLDSKIEKSKSKGFHVWVFFNESQERNFIKNILEDAVNNATDKKIANGEIEVFPKGDKGNGIFLPFFRMFKAGKTVNEEFFKEKNACLIKGSKMKAIENPIESIKQSINNNTFTLRFLSKLQQYPQCIRKAALNWAKGERNTLALGSAGVLKKISKISEEEAIEIIKEIALFNKDEEIDMRINAVKSTYKSDEVAGCSIMQGKNSNMSLSTSLCESNCDLIDKNTSIKGKIRELQLLNKGQILKDKIAQFVIDTIKNNGKIYISNNKFYLFLQEEKEIIPMVKDSISLMNLMTKWGINAAETLYKYVFHELVTYANENAIEVDIHRVAYFNNENFTLYLYNTPKSILKITKNTITTIENGDEGILFEELRNYQPFELVNFDKNVDYLSEFFIKKLNIDRNDFNINIHKLVEIWFFSLFFESIMPTKPLFVLIGEKGSGKTSFLRRAGQFLIGEKFDVTSVSMDNKNLTTLITNNYFVVLDNMDSPTTEINDTLARVSTGQIIMVRDYYTTNNMVEFEAKCYVALTSRKPHFTRDDVSDRLVCVFLKRFEAFSSENKLKRNAMQMRNLIMSYVVSKLQDIIRNIEHNQNIKYSGKCRMADFAEFALRSTASKKEQEAIYNLFDSLAKQQKAFAMQDDIICTLLKEIVADTYNCNKKYTSAELYVSFKHKAEELELDRFFNHYYQTPKALTTHLMNIQDNVADSIIINRQKGHGNNYYYSFVCIDESKPLTSNIAVVKLMNRPVEQQINAYEQYLASNGSAQNE